MPRSLIACITAAATLATGCAASRPWPTHPVAVSTPFASQGAISTIDVLPLDLQLWTEPGYEGNLDELRAGTELGIMNVALDALTKRNYSVGAMIDWNGDYPGGNALPREDLLATLGSLARYGASTAELPGQLPVPFLPARLGTTTGSDATLYVGGWAYVPRHRESTGDKIVKGVAIALIVVAVVVLIAMATEDSKPSKSKKSSKHGGDHGERPSVVTVRHHRHTPLRAGAALADAFGRTAINIALTAPDWQDDPNLPREGGDPEMYLEMTMIENRTGLALWHAHQRFPASAAKAADAARVAQTVLAMLPARSGPPPALPTPPLPPGPTPAAVPEPAPAPSMDLEPAPAPAPEPAIAPEPAP